MFFKEIDDFSINSSDMVFRKQNMQLKSENCRLGLIETVRWQLLWWKVSHF